MNKEFSKILFGKPTIQFCEKAGSGLIKRPFYAISNLSFLIVGILILGKNTRYSKAFGYMSILVGLFSFLYDASYTYLSQIFDLFGMLLFANLIIYLSARRYFSYTSKQILASQAIAILVGLSTIIFFKSYAGDYVFGIFLIFAIVLEYLLWRSGKTNNIKLWIIALIIFALGFLLWLPDASGLWCDPRNRINGRSLFHVLTSITIWLLYKYYELQKT